MITENDKDMEPVDPRIWHSNIPVFRDRPLTRKEHNQVIACLKPTNGVMTTVALNVELAAVFLARALGSSLSALDNRDLVHPYVDYLEEVRQVVWERAEELKIQGRV